ncbi:MAG TPA: tetratricopeptide repeat protein [Polyangiaceae bacterium LLY-WYZ-15_(1-7)]|nr:tetratricopeptide repeat protein [Polyangiaceae bacterium LLY-WYZ-15_(1-7)]
MLRVPGPFAAERPRRASGRRPRGAPAGRAAWQKSTIEPRPFRAHAAPPMLRFAPWLGAFALVAALATPAGAQGSALRDSGVRLQAEGEHEAAIAVLERALVRGEGSRGQLLSDLARSEAALGRRAQAAERLREALALEGDAWVDEHAAELAERLAALGGGSESAEEERGDMPPDPFGPAEGSGATDPGTEALPFPSAPEDTSPALPWRAGGAPPTTDPGAPPAWSTPGEFSLGFRQRFAAPDEPAALPAPTPWRGFTTLGLVFGAGAWIDRDDRWGDPDRFREAGGQLDLGAALVGPLVGSLSWHAELRLTADLDASPAERDATELQEPYGEGVVSGDERAFGLVLAASARWGMGRSPLFLGLGARGGPQWISMPEARITASVRGYASEATQPAQRESFADVVVQGLAELGLRRNGWEGRFVFAAGRPNFHVQFFFVAPLWRSAQ